MLKWQGVGEGLWPLKIPSWKISYEDHSRSVRFWVFWEFLGGFFSKQNLTQKSFFKSKIHSMLRVDYFQVVKLISKTTTK